MIRACDACLARARLIELLSPRIARLVDKADRPVRELLRQTDDTLLAAAGVAEEEREELLRQAAHAALQDRGRPVDGGAVCIHDDAYPHPLRDLTDAPRALFHTGALQRLCELCASRPVAVVGSRRASAQAKENAYGLGRGLAAAGVTVVSGMAFGIDAACHWGALAGGGRPLAVLASGADRASPAGNRALYRELRRAGTVISEMPWGARPLPWLFPARNRIMAALSEATVVVEARDKSGSLHTVEFASNLGRTVAAMPGPPNAALAAGSNRLLRDGVPLIRGAVDVLDELYDVGSVPAPPAPTRHAIAGDQVLHSLLDAVEVGETLEQMSARCGLGARDLRAALARLEGAGLVRRNGLRGYVATTTG